MEIKREDIAVILPREPDPRDARVIRRLLRATEILLYYTREIDSREKAA